MTVMATEDVCPGPLAQVLRISYVNSMEDTAARYMKGTTVISYIEDRASRYMEDTAARYMEDTAAI